MKAACVLLAAAAGAMGQTVPVVNGDFESPTLSPNGFTVDTPVSGWTPVATGQDWGVFYPTMASWSFVAPLNHQVLYTNGPTLEQVTTTNAVAGQSYTLRVDVVNRPDFNGNNYVVELWAGSVLLARDNNSLHPAVGGFLTSVLVGTAGASAAGQPLKIRLGGANQSNFDDVRLSIGGCYANCDNSTTPPILNVLDFTCFLNEFAAGSQLANCDGSTTAPVLNVLDFTCFLNKFAAGCT
jgi:hypothetical protein